MIRSRQIFPEYRVSSGNICFCKCILFRNNMLNNDDCVRIFFFRGFSTQASGKGRSRGPTPVPVFPRPSLNDDSNASVFFCIPAQNLLTHLVCKFCSPSLRGQATRSDERAEVRCKVSTRWIDNQQTRRLGRLRYAPCLRHGRSLTHTLASADFKNDIRDGYLLLNCSLCDDSVVF